MGLACVLPSIGWSCRSLPGLADRFGPELRRTPAPNTAVLWYHSPRPYIVRPSIRCKVNPYGVRMSRGDSGLAARGKRPGAVGMKITALGETGADRRAALTREQVLAAAVRLADRDGIESLSMRKLGQELRVEAMSLYTHVRNKDDLLDGMVE